MRAYLKVPEPEVRYGPYWERVTRSRGILYILNHQFLLVLELGNGKDLHVSFRHVTRLLLRVSKEVLRHYRRGGTCCVSCFKESQCLLAHNNLALRLLSQDPQIDFRM